MKCYLLILISFFFVVNAQDFEYLNHLEFDECHAIDFSDLDQDFAITIPKNALIPIRVSMSGPLLRLEGVSNIKLRLLQQMFFLNKEKEFLVSIDKIKWYPFQEFFDIASKIGVAFEAGQGLVIDLKLDVNLKH